MNFCIFTAVYVMATLLWLRFDSTKPVVPEAVQESPPEPLDGPPSEHPPPL